MATPKFVLPDWSTDPAAPGVLTLHVSLTADCKVAGVELDAVKGHETEAAMVSFQLGELLSDKLKEAGQHPTDRPPNPNLL